MSTEKMRKQLIKLTLQNLTDRTSESVEAARELASSGDVPLACFVLGEIVGGNLSIFYSFRHYYSDFAEAELEKVRKIALEATLAFVSILELESLDALEDYLDLEGMNVANFQEMIDDFDVPTE